MLGTWVVTNPPGAAPDETNHYLRALAVGRGDAIGRPNPQLADPVVAAAPPKSVGIEALAASWAARGARLVEVPRELGPSTAFGCEAFDPTKTSSCQRQDGGERIAGEVLTTMGTVEPGPYILPGLATRLARGPRSGLLLARFGAAIPVALLIAAAVAVAAWSPAALGGVVLAITPMALFVGSTVSGSGLEVAAAVCFFTTALRVTIGPDPTPSMWAIAGASGVALAISRSLGPVWLLVGLVATTALVGRRCAEARVRAGGRAAVAAGAAISVASGLTVVWEALYQPGLDFDMAWFRHELGPSVGALVGAGREVIGVFGSIDTHMPGAAYVMWAALLVGFIVLALVVGTSRQRAVLGIAVPGVVGITVAVSAGIMRQNGFGLQGRHVLPLATFLPLLAGAVVAANRNGATSMPPRWVVAATAAPLTAVQAIAWYANARRYAVGARGPVLFFTSSEWAPPGGWVPWLVVVVVVVVATVAGVVISTRPLPVAPRTMRTARSRSSGGHRF